MGQYGSDRVSMPAVHAMATGSRSCAAPSATRGRRTPRTSAAPAALPIPSPMSTTARMMEKVYVVAPSSNDRSRVHTTSAPRAHMPDSAMARYTVIAPCGALGAVRRRGPVAGLRVV